MWLCCAPRAAVANAQPHHEIVPADRRQLPLPSIEAEQLLINMLSQFCDAIVHLDDFVFEVRA